MYVSYTAALEMCGIDTLFMRREKRSLQFGLKCVRHPTNNTMFPLSQSADTHNIRNREKFAVNKAASETYRKSVIPDLQRRLNLHFQRLEQLRRSRDRAAGARRRGRG
jgi:hypothetical protein